MPMEPGHTSGSGYCYIRGTVVAIITGFVGVFLYLFPEKEHVP